MERWEITADQRELAIELLANALRKDAHLRERARNSGQQDDFMSAGMARRRGEASQRYIDGMRDMLRILFPNGDAVAAECLEAAYARAMGIRGTGANGSGDSPHQ